MNLSKVRDNDTTQLNCNTTQPASDLNLTTEPQNPKFGNLDGVDTMKQKLKSNWKMIFNKDVSKDFRINTEASRSNLDGDFVVGEECRSPLDKSIEDKRRIIAMQVGKRGLKKGLPAIFHSTCKRASKVGHKSLQKMEG